MNDNENMAGSSSSPIISVAPQSPDIGDSINGINFTNTAVSPSLISQSAKKDRGHPREYHTDTARNQLLIRRCQPAALTHKMSDNEKMESSSSPTNAAPQSPTIGEPPTTSNDNINHNTTAQSPSLSQSANKGRGRPPKYQTDAEREEAKRRYRENHKTKAAGGGVSNFGNASATANFAVASQPKQQDIDDSQEDISGLQEQVAGSIQLAQRDVAALPGQKHRKV